ESGGRQLGAAPWDHERLQRLPEPFVGRADDGGLRDVGMCEEECLHLGREDAEPGYVDDLLQPAGDPDMTLVVDVADVARPEPAVDERLGGLLRPPEVTRRDPGAAHPQLASAASRFARRLDVPVEPGKRSPRRRVADGGGIVETTARRCGDLRHSVEVEYAHADAVELFEQ